GGHVLQVLRHAQREVVLVEDLLVGLPELRELSYQLVVAKNGVRVVRWVVHDPASELRGGGTNANCKNQQDSKDFSSHEHRSFLAFTSRKASDGCCSRAGPGRLRDTPSRGGLRGW